jgi:hypothetical protein
MVYMPSTPSTPSMIPMNIPRTGPCSPTQIPTQVSSTGLGYEFVPLTPCSQLASICPRDGILTVLHAAIPT